jgi:hypothetical protein
MIERSGLGWEYNVSSIRVRAHSSVYKRIVYTGLLALSSN